MKLLICLLLANLIVASCGQSKAESNNFRVINVNGIDCITNGYGVSCDWR